MEGQGVKARRRLVSCVVCVCVRERERESVLYCALCMHHALKTAKACMSKEVKYSFVCASVTYVVFNG